MKSRRLRVLKIGAQACCGVLCQSCRSLGPGGADPARLKQLPIASTAVWALYVGEQQNLGNSVMGPLR